MRLLIIWCTTVSCALQVILAVAVNHGISVNIDLGHYFNNKGVSASPGGADFNGHNGSYPLSQLPSGSLLYRGINFKLPQWGSSSTDNILAQGQIIKLTEERFQSLHILGAGDGSSIYTNNISVVYSDGTTATQPVLFPGWRSGRGIVISNFTYTSNGIDGNTTHMHYFQIPLNAEKHLSSITLPTGDISGTRFHVFAMSFFTSSSLLSHSSSRPALTFQYVRSRSQWYNDGGLQRSSVETTALSFMKVLDDMRPVDSVIQVVEVAISNLPFEFDLRSWLTGEHTVEISSSHLQTVYAGRLRRLRPGDQARVKVGVVNTEGTARGMTTHAQAVVKDAKGAVIATSPSFEITAGIPVYDNTLASLAQHEAPKWFEDSKFG